VIKDENLKEKEIYKEFKKQELLDGKYKQKFNKFSINVKELENNLKEIKKIKPNKILIGEEKKLNVFDKKNVIKQKLNKTQHLNKLDQQVYQYHINELSGDNTYRRDYFWYTNHIV
jgi:hypothetical protein